MMVELRVTTWRTQQVGQFLSHNPSGIMVTQIRHLLEHLEALKQVHKPGGAATSAGVANLELAWPEHSCAGATAPGSPLKGAAPIWHVLSPYLPSLLHLSLKQVHI